MGMMLQWMSDGGLVRRTLSGNREAFGVLVERHLPMAHAVAWGHTGSSADAEDLVQDAFLRAFTKLDTLREAEKFAGWLAGIVRNLAADLRVHRARAATVSTAVLAELPAATKPVEDEELHALLREALAALEAPAREVITLHYFARKSLREVAEVQGITREAAMKRLQRAREALGKQLLERLEGPVRPAGALRARKQLILAAIATTPVAWHAAAATGIGAGGIVVAAIALTILAGLGAGGFAFREALLGADPTATADNSAIQAPRDVVPVAAVPAVIAAPPEAPPDAMATPASGEPGAIFGTVMDLNGVKVPNATVRVERVDWEPTEFPPAETKRFETVADATGAYRLANLPLGEYSVVAIAGSAADSTRSPLDEYTKEREEDLYLKPGLPIAGRVVDSQGAPVAGAMLIPHTYAPMGPINDYTVASASRVYTDESGRFRVSLIWLGGWKFIVRAKGLAPTLSEMIEAGTQDAVITLGGAAKVTGTVTRATTSAPASKVRVRLASSNNDGESPSAETDADGRFEVSDLAPGAYRVELASDVEAIQQGPKEIVVEAGREYPIELVLGGGGTISGRLIDKESGEGIPGVQVSLNSYGGGDIYRNVVTDALGGFFFPSLPDGAYQLYPQLGGKYFLDGEARGLPIQIASAREVDVNIVATRGVRIAGKVVDAEGQAVKDAGVGVSAPYSAVGGDFTFTGNSDADGNFEVWILSAADPLKVSAWSGPLSSNPQTLSQVGPQGVEGVLITLDQVADSSVEVSVPIKGLEQQLAAQVIEANLVPDGGEGRSAPAVRVPPHGKVTFEKVLAGRYMVNLVNRTSHDNFCQSEPIEVPPSSTVSGIVLPCEQGGDLSIAGTVTAASGKVIAGATLRVRTEATEIATTSDAEGHFTLPGLKAGTQYINVRAKGYSSDSKYAEAGDENVEIVLDPWRVIRGRVQYAATGAPVPKFSVFLTSEDKMPTTASALYSHGTYREMRPFVAADGRFELADISNFYEYIMVHADGCVPMGQVARLGDAGELQFSLVQGATISGVVTAPGGQALSGVQVGLARPEGWADSEAAVRATTDIEGHYVLAGVTPGLLLKFMHPQFAGTRREVTSGTQLDVVLDLGGTLVGRIDPWPIPGGQCMVFVRGEFAPGSLGSEEQLRVENNGTFRLERLSAGMAQVKHYVVYSTGDANVSRAEEFPPVDVKIVNGEETSVVLKAELAPEAAALPEGESVQELPE